VLVHAMSFSFCRIPKDVSAFLHEALEGGLLLADHGEEGAVNL